MILQVHPLKPYFGYHGGSFSYFMWVILSGSLPPKMALQMGNSGYSFTSYMRSPTVSTVKNHGHHHTEDLSDSDDEAVANVAAVAKKVDTKVAPPEATGLHGTDSYWETPGRPSKRFLSLQTAVSEKKVAFLIFPYDISRILRVENICICFNNKQQKTLARC